MAFNATTPTSKLDAVNQMLLSVGEAPVSTLTNAGLISVTTATEHLEATTRDVLGRGWDFNTDTEYLLSFDADDLSPTYKQVLLPSNAITVDPTLKYKNYTIRKDTVNDVFALWDKDNHTFEIAEDVEVDVVWAFSFEDVPDLVRRYVFVKAARRFANSQVASEVLYQFTREDEEEAKREARKADAGKRDVNMLYGSDETNYIHQRTRNPIRFR